MMKLQNIANIILNEQSKLDSNIVSGTDVVRNKNWYVELSAEDIVFGGLVLAKGRNTVPRDELVKFAKTLSDAKPNKKMQGNNLEDVINYLNSFNIFKVYPKMHFDNKFLVRDSNNVIFLVNHPSARERTHWPDVKFEKNIDKNWVWTNSIPLGKSNDEWLNKNYKISNINLLTQESFELAQKLAIETEAWWKEGGGGDRLKQQSDNRTSTGDDEVWFAIQYNEYCQRQLKNSGLKTFDPYYKLMKAWLIGKNQIIGKNYTYKQWYNGNGDELAGQESIDVELDMNTMEVKGNPYSICAEIDDGWAFFGGQDPVFLILREPDGTPHYYQVDPEIQ